MLSNKRKLKFKKKVSFSGSDDNDNDLSGDEVNADELSAANMCWADAVNKIINSNNQILSKAKKDSDVKSREPEEKNVEIIDEKGNVKQLSEGKSLDDRKKKKRRTNKTDWERMAKLKPSLDDRPAERLLAAIATKGVVQLFNAVREQQHSIKRQLSQIGSSETKRDKALAAFTKHDFLDKLKTNKSEHSVDKKKTQTSHERKWKVLRDDFMVGAKMKDWDKVSDSESDRGE